MSKRHRPSASLGTQSNAGWKTKRLGELAKLAGRIGWRGLTAKEYTESGPLFLSVHSLNYGDSVDFRDAFHITQARYDESPEIMLRLGDILICKDGAGIGKLGIVTELPSEATINSSLLMIRPGESILDKYLYYCLSSPYFQQIVLSRLNGATTPHLYQRDITDFPVHFPSRDEQARIVAVIDGTFEAIAIAKANARINQNRASSLLAQELSNLIAIGTETWTSSPLGSTTKFIDYRGRTPEKTDSGIPLITAKNVRMGYVKDEPREFVAQESYEGWMTRGVPKKGDVLFTTEAPLANVAQLETSDRVVFAQRIIIMQPDSKKLDSTFLKFLLLSPPIQKRIHEKGTGATATGIKASLLKAISIPFPASVEEQVRLSDRLTELSRDADRLAALYVQKVNALDALQHSVLHQAFSGNL